MTFDEQTQVRNEMVSAIKTRIANPGEWLAHVRWIAERIGLRVERFLPIGSVTLMTACAAVVDEASKQGRTTEHTIAAVIEWCGYHPAPTDALDRRNTA